MAYSEYATTTETTQALAPSLPTPGIIRVSDRRVTEIDLDWDAVMEATSYLLEVTLNYAGTWTLVYDGPALSVTATDLLPDTRYFFRLFAVNEAGMSGPSPMIAVRTRPIPEPAKPPETWSVVKRIAQKFTAKTVFSGKRQ